jgi:hypothetical protein
MMAWVENKGRVQFSHDHLQLGQHRSSFQLSLHHQVFFLTLAVVTKIRVLLPAMASLLLCAICPWQV